MKRKIIILNPNKTNLIGKKVQDFFLRSKIPPKYDFLLKLINEKKIIIYCDKDSLSIKLYFIKNIKIKNFLFYFIKYVEIYLWLIINKISIFKASIFFDKKIISKEDILFSFSHQVIDKNDAFTNEILSLDCIKVFHLSHYIFFTKKIADNIKNKININFIAENNLYKNSNYFKKHFTFFNGKFLGLPFSVRKKFIKINNYENRKNKCMAIGTYQDILGQINNEAKDFFNFYKQSTIHPLRKLIDESCKNKNDFIDNFTSKITNVKRYDKRKYYDFDLVSKFNSYKMFICPEELGDLPGISFAEGMMCGSAYIGAHNDMYADLGMKDGINYIAHDGSYEDIIDKILFYQNNNKILEYIANRGHEIAKKLFNDDYVVNKFLNFLYNLENLNNEK
jgi:hypothetical protein